MNTLKRTEALQRAGIPASFAQVLAAERGRVFGTAEGFVEPMTETEVRHAVEQLNTAIASASLDRPKEGSE